MFLPVQSIMDRTWGSGAPPPEFITFTLCDQMKVSPLQLRTEFSLYEMKYFWDFYQIRWEQEAADAEAAQNKNKSR